jgi:DNA-binding MarR family transcriptional regulator
MKQVNSLDPQLLGDKPIRDREAYMSSLRGLSSKQKFLLGILSSKFLHEPTFRASTKWLAGRLSCSRPTLHRVLRALEGRWIVIRRYRGKQSFYGPAPRFANVIRRCLLRNG